MNKIIFGIVIPALVFIISFIITWLLYRHFAKGSGAPGRRGVSASKPRQP